MDALLPSLLSSPLEQAPLTDVAGGPLYTAVADDVVGRAIMTMETPAPEAKLLTGSKFLERLKAGLHAGKGPALDLLGKTCLILDAFRHPSHGGADHTAHDFEKIFPGGNTRQAELFNLVWNVHFRRGYEEGIEPYPAYVSLIRQYGEMKNLENAKKWRCEAPPADAPLGDPSLPVDEKIIAPTAESFHSFAIDPEMSDPLPATAPGWDNETTQMGDEDIEPDTTMSLKPLPRIQGETLVRALRGIESHQPLDRITFRRDDFLKILQTIDWPEFTRALGLTEDFILTAKLAADDVAGIRIYDSTEEEWAPLASSQYFQVRFGMSSHEPNRHIHLVEGKPDSLNISAVLESLAKNKTLDWNETYRAFPDTWDRTAREAIETALNRGHLYFARDRRGWDAGVIMRFPEFLVRLNMFDWKKPFRDYPLFRVLFPETPWSLVFTGSPKRNIMSRIGFHPADHRSIKDCFDIDLTAVRKRKGSFNLQVTGGRGSKYRLVLEALRANRTIDGINLEEKEAPSAPQSPFAPEMIDFSPADLPEMEKIYRELTADLPVLIDRFRYFRRLLKGRIFVDSLQEAFLFAAMAKAKNPQADTDKIISDYLKKLSTPLFTEISYHPRPDEKEDWL
ncbi:MAG: hypothetical protein HY541_06620, partial [Deltaproteobacteria bacterium]|nr:hypothetical protein [Deltaproteobacteria bacterium]